MSETLSTILYALTIFGANTIQGITGFAGNVLAMPPCIYLIGVGYARAALNGVGFMSGAFLAVPNRKHINWKALGIMMAMMIPGVVVGILLFNVLPSKPMIIGYGIAIFIIGLHKLFGKHQKVPPRFVLFLIVFLAGVMQGAFVSGGALLVIYALIRIPEKNEFRATLSAVWVITNAIVFAQDVIAGGFDMQSLTYIAIAVVPLIVAMWLGNKLAKRLPQNVFLNITCVLIVISGVIMVVNNLL